MQSKTGNINGFKLQAINWYLNNNQIIRKLKLEKIKEKYES